MTQPLLSILVPLTPDRREVYALLRNEVVRQVFENSAEKIIQFTFDEDDKTITIGEKRERMYKNSLGVYSWQIDSDDLIAPNAIELILDAIKKRPDCITFRERCMINDKYYSSNHSLKYDKWRDNFDGFDYVRTPFYKDVIRTDIAKSVPFEYIRWNEDERWSYALLPHLKTEIHIEEELYHYIHNSTPSHERYGFDKD